MVLPQGSINELFLSSSCSDVLLLQLMAEKRKKKWSFKRRITAAVSCILPKFPDNFLLAQHFHLFFFLRLKGRASWCCWMAPLRIPPLFRAATWVFSDSFCYFEQPVPLARYCWFHRETIFLKFESNSAFLKHTWKRFPGHKQKVHLFQADSIFQCRPWK